MPELTNWLFLIAGLGFIATGLWQLGPVLGFRDPPPARTHARGSRTPRARGLQGLGSLVYGLGGLSRGLVPLTYDPGMTWVLLATILICLTCWWLAWRIDAPPPRQ